MKPPKEIIDCFSNEVSDIIVELNHFVSKLKTDIDQPELYEKFGQVVDRIYGTAITMDLVEMGEYARAMKEVCYMCSQSNNEEGQRKVFKMMERCLTFLETMRASLHDPEKITKIKDLLEQEKRKAEHLNRSSFFSIKRKSTTK